MILTSHAMWTVLSPFHFPSMDLLNEKMSSVRDTDFESCMRRNSRLYFFAGTMGRGKQFCPSNLGISKSISEHGGLRTNAVGRCLLSSNLCQFIGRPYA